MRAPARIMPRPQTSALVEKLRKVILEHAGQLSFAIIIRMPSKLGLVILGIVTVTLSLSTHPAFDWSSIIPSRALVYSKCYDRLECARLLVPLDWQDSENNQTVAIAIIKLPAAVSDSDPRFGGTIITNPGRLALPFTLRSRRSRESRAPDTRLGS